MTPVLHPVTTRLVRPEWAARVVSPAYDAVGADGRRALMASDPYVFLHVTRSPEDAERPLTPQEALDRNAEALDRFLAADVFSPVHPPGLYLYRLRLADHEQIAVVGDIHLAAFDDGRLLPHERIRPQRAEVLADHLQRLRVGSSPVAATYRHDPAIDAIVAEARDRDPVLDFVREDRLEQTIWRVDEPLVAPLLDAFAERVLYIVDGHHRVAAGQVYRERVGAAAGPHHFVLGALFPENQLRIAPFHRRVTDLAGFGADDLLAALVRAGFTVEPLHGTDPTPRAHGEFGMYLAGRWYHLRALGEPPDELDVTELQHRILGPLLGVDETSPDARLEYLPGVHGLEDLVARCGDDGGVAFALHPVAVEQLLSLVDRGETMPPKSTYFEPKVRSGVFLVPR